MEIGRTSPTKTGYYVIVSSVTFNPGEDGGKVKRIRLTLMCYEKYIRHLDLTSLICKELVDILDDASNLGAACSLC